MTFRFDRPKALDAIRHLEHDFANGASFYRLVRLPRRFEGETGTREMVELTPCEELGNLSHGGVLGRLRHIVNQDETDGDVAGLELQRDGRLGSDARGIDGEDAIAAQDLSADRKIPRKVHLDDVVYARAAGEIPDALHGVFSPVVDSGLGTGSQGDLGLLV